MAMLYGVQRSRNDAFKHRRQNVLQTGVWFETNVFFVNYHRWPIDTSGPKTVSFDKGRETKNEKFCFRITP